jgi:hypothetical protein
MVLPSSFVCVFSFLNGWMPYTTTTVVLVLQRQQTMSGLMNPPDSLKRQEPATLVGLTMTATTDTEPQTTYHQQNIWSQAPVESTHECRIS